ncbi:symmetrical bis(5'-nucleosyl)-tetraphosphatase [Pseudidiomarina gelatinasegens]|uniref:bis(5'-nucleosyl)-tetraphosphatase (symmetrical) n=1 Tax=Pseudidiomarina gelatinasegens TaxID=2487740 RepID=A0A443YY99_9GAMM|nr:symmetrical bis(5'-nucleosyl)-tetraphosphatase [Pseudidiomarina gelatinasegens]RWU09023.1 symmetrical bis(5'-nucleosyl)-tetraphosphatase [Pseudidiomarina gelatinasegens]
MARYLVGDIQGCAEQVSKVLEQASFNPKFDELWCVGDLVGRGPASLRSLEIVRELGASAHIVLGNHDLNLLAVLCGVREADPKDKLGAILALTDAEKRDWIGWLVQQPLLLRSNDNLVMTHAGIYPWWTIDQAENYANEVSTALQTAWTNDQLPGFLQSMYGNEPSQWTDDLQGDERIRFIINAFTRMRFCDTGGHLNFSVKTAPNDPNVPEHLVPWFELWDVSDTTLVFGHWAALMGNTQRDDVIALDTGCVWGEHLTLMQWPNGQCIRAPGV